MFTLTYYPIKLNKTNTFVGWGSGYGDIDPVIKKILVHKIPQCFLQTAAIFVYLIL